jgi:hypothetical protein
LRASERGPEGLVDYEQDQTIIAVGSSGKELGMAYKTPEGRRRQIKEAVLHEIMPSVSSHVCGREVYLLGEVRIHVRFCAKGEGNYKFNINPNTLRADYELWICGKPEHWYLIPVRVLQEMYDHPAAYPDKTHPEIRVVSLDATHHLAGYAAPSVKRDMRSYFGATLAKSGQS